MKVKSNLTALLTALAYVGGLSLIAYGGNWLFNRGEGKTEYSFLKRDVNFPIGYVQYSKINNGLESIMNYKLFSGYVPDLGLNIDGDDKIDIINKDNHSYSRERDYSNHREDFDEMDRLLLEKRLKYQSKIKF